MYTISEIFNSALQPFSSAKLRAISSPVEIVKNAMLELESNITLVESHSVIPLIPALFYGDNIYSLPQDTVGQIIDLAPMKNISSQSLIPELQASRVLSRDYLNLSQYLSIEYREGYQYLNVQQNLQKNTPIVLSNCDTETGVTGLFDASNVEVNTLYAREESSIDFDLAITNGVGEIVFAIDSTDISTITRDGTIQMQVDLPEALIGKLTNVSIKLGNDDAFASNAEMVVTRNAFGARFQYGYQPLQFIYRSKTLTGSFDEAAITHVKVRFEHTLTEAVKGVRIDGIQALKGIAYELHFYNKKHYVNSAGTMILTPTVVGDKVIVEREAYQILVNECRKLIDFELNGNDGGLQYKLATQTLMGIYPNAGLYERYRLKYPAEVMVEVSDY